MDKQVIAERINDLRKDLAQRTGEKWPMKRVATESGIKEGMIERIEAGRGGTVEIYFDLINFYHSKGYNLNWIMASDNSRYSKYRVEDINSVEIEKIMVKIENFKSQMVDQVDTMIMDFLVNS